MTDRAIETSPQVYARVGGVLYLITIVAGIFGELFVKDKLIVSGDATATANNIMAHELLFRISAAGQLIELVAAVAVALILYVLLRPVSTNLALLAVFFNLVSIAVEGVTRLSLFAVLLLLGGADYLNGVDPVWWTLCLLRRKGPPWHSVIPTHRSFRSKIVELVRAGRSIDELAREFEPSPQTIRNWVKQIELDAGRRSDGLTSQERDELGRLRKENKQRKLEREILSKAYVYNLG